AQFASQALEDPMLSRDIPDRSWPVMWHMWDRKWHLVSTCHYGDWVEISVLPNTLTLMVVPLAKAHFAKCWDT
ncbi:unnamed protein product, partial [Pocillopora meandrina]